VKYPHSAPLLIATALSIGRSHVPTASITIHGDRARGRREICFFAELSGPRGILFDDRAAHAR
jgi:hypothetical protein